MKGLKPKTLNDHLKDIQRGNYSFSKASLLSFTFKSYKKEGGSVTTALLLKKGEFSEYCG